MNAKRHSQPAAEQRPLLDGRRVHRVVFVTGKGGVGKSMVAAATALQLARAGQHVQLVEFGSSSFFGPLLGLKVGNEPVRWKPRVAVARWDVESSLREYITHYLVFKAAADRILGNTVMKALVAAAPGLAEMALLARVTAPMRHTWYHREVDAVVVDAYSSGQFMALLRAPRGLSETAAQGPMHTQTAAVTRVLSQPEVCEYRLVTLAEELPIAEARETAAAIRQETGIAPTVYCNRVVELPARLPALPADDAARAFVDDMKRIAARQRTAAAALEALDADRAGPVRWLPLVPRTDAEAVLEGLADALEAMSAAPR